MKRYALLLLPLAVLPFAPRLFAAGTNQEVPPVELPADPGPARPQAEPARPDVPIEHRRLLEEVGTWAAEIKVFAAPGMPPMNSTGHEVNFMLGDAWLVSEFTGVELGKTFHGLGQTSFDIERGVAIGTWIDSDSASLRFMEGTYDLQRRERVFTYTEPGSGGELERFRATTRSLSAEHRTFDLVRLGSGDEETPVMHIDYRLESR